MQNLFIIFFTHSHLIHCVRVALLAQNPADSTERTVEMYIRAKMCGWCKKALSFRCFEVLFVLCGKTDVWMTHRKTRRYMVSIRMRMKKRMIYDHGMMLMMCCGAQYFNWNKLIEIVLNVFQWCSIQFVTFKAVCHLYNEYSFHSVAPLVRVRGLVPRSGIAPRNFSSHDRGSERGYSDISRFSDGKVVMILFFQGINRNNR